MTKKTPKFSRVEILSVILLVVLLVVASAILVHNFKIIKWWDNFGPKHSFSGMFLKHQRNHESLSPEDASKIEEWMTFSYIDFRYDIPPDYLSKSLNITDTKFPDISLAVYAKSKGIDSKKFLEEVRTVVRNFTPEAPVGEVPNN